MISAAWKALQRSSRGRSLKLTQVGCLFSTLQSSCEKPLASSLPESQILDILRQSCGLPLKDAVSISKRLHIVHHEKLHTVVNFLKSHGLTKSQIRKAVISRPGILSCDLDADFKPNVQVFESLGISGSDLSQIIARDPAVIMSNSKAVVDFFRSQGFNQEQIVRLTMKRPSLYQLNVDKNLQPKFDYFRNLGLSDLKIATMLSMKPFSLERSLECHLKPSIELLQRLFRSEDKVIKVITGFSRVLEAKLNQMLENNVKILMAHGVVESNVLKAFDFHPSPLLIKSERFREVVDEALKMGFDPKHLMFLLAVRTLGILPTSRWQKKLEIFQSYGLSKEDVLSAFRRQPMCMIVSEEKITKLMNFYVKKLGIDPLSIAGLPNLILLSFEKRVLPRSTVLQILLSKGLIETGKMRLTKVFTETEKRFVAKFVNKYIDQAPEVIKAHQGKVKFKGLPVKLKD